MDMDEFIDNSPEEALSSLVEVEDGNTPPSLDSADFISLDNAAITSCASSLPTCSFLTGIAGSGKTYQIRQRIAELDTDPTTEGSVLLAASTGIAAVNLGAGITTIHSLLKFFDTASLQDQYLTGRLQRTLGDLYAGGVRELVIDEVSMFPGEMIDLIYMANLELADRSNPEGGKMQPLRITLVGDFCQLPPVKSRFAFEAERWPEFAKNTTRLTKVWRQDNVEFLSALNLLRAGKGGEAGEVLRGIGVRFHNSIQDEFEGATIRPKNDEVDRYNAIRLAALPGKAFGLRTDRWGTKDIFQVDSANSNMFVKQPGDWKDIPRVQPLKIGARVMILSNDSQGGWRWVNGDAGTLRGLSKAGEGEGGGVGGVGVEEGGTLLEIELDRKPEEVIRLPKLTRDISRKGLGQDWKDRLKEMGIKAPEKVGLDEAKRLGIPWWQAGAGRSGGKWIFGQLTYFPIRLAWATTVHKTQGLTLDRIQVDMRGHFFSAPAMSYVSLSRCRTAEGLRLVGRVDDLAKGKIDERVRGWL